MEVDPKPLKPRCVAAIGGVGADADLGGPCELARSEGDPLDHELIAVGVVFGGGLEVDHDGSKLHRMSPRPYEAIELLGEQGWIRHQQSDRSIVDRDGDFDLISGDEGARATIGGGTDGAGEDSNRSSNKGGCGSIDRDHWCDSLG